MSLPQRATCCALVLLAAATAAGCGGGASGAQLKALNQEYQSARKEIDPEKRARSLISVARKQQRASNAKGFESAVADILRAASELSDGAARCSIYARLAVLLKQGEQLDAANKVMDKSRAALDEIDDVDGLLTAVEDMARAQQLAFEDRAGANEIMASAVGRATQIPETSGRVMYLCELAKRLHKKPWGNRDASGEALQRALEECDAQGGARAATGRIRVADLQCQLNAESKAVATLKLAKDFAEQEPDPGERVYALVSIAQALNGLNQPEVVQAVLQAAEETVAGIDNKRDQQDAARHLDAVRQEQR